MSRIGIVGATSWGTTLGVILAREGHDVGFLGPPRQRIALPNRILGRLPVGGGQALGMIVEAVEIEGRTMSGEIAGVSRGVNAL